jgi:glycerol-3-phosphate dehydrogenase
VVVDPSHCFSREYQLSRVDPAKKWDIIIIGGGATGIGAAVDASSRGYSVLLLESHDFGKGTSSRSTKLIHGGVRYLQQFQVGMVKESLRERGRLLQNAPQLVHELEFVIPCRSVWERFYYGTGLKLYDLLAIGSKAQRSSQVSAMELCRKFANLKRDRFAGGVRYSDAQFDDARLVIELARSAAIHGACLLNHAPVLSLVHNAAGKTVGVVFKDQESGKEMEVLGRAVVNATGPFCDAIRKLDHRDTQPLVAASQGIHLVLPKRFFPSQSAIIVPKTSDGRVLFIIPWLNHVVVGTTDTAIETAVEEPLPYSHEIDFLLETIADYLEQTPTREDCLSVFVGIRPLVGRGKNQPTKRLSRDHTIEISPSGLLTITGGKWTTYRKMAEDCVDQVAEFAGLPNHSCKTKDMRIASEQTSSAAERGNPRVLQLSPDLSLTSSQITGAIEQEFARTLEDILARRTRCLFLNANASAEAAPEIAAIAAQHLGRGREWQAEQVNQFRALAKAYSPSSYK